MECDIAFFLPFIEITLLPVHSYGDILLSALRAGSVCIRGLLGPRSPQTFHGATVPKRSSGLLRSGGVH